MGISRHEGPSHLYDGQMRIAVGRRKKAMILIGLSALVAVAYIVLSERALDRSTRSVERALTQVIAGMSHSERAELTASLQLGGYGPNAALDALPVGSEAKLVEVQVRGRTSVIVYEIRRAIFVRCIRVTYKGLGPPHIMTNRSAVCPM